MKKILSVILAAVLVLSLSVSVHAEDELTKDQAKARAREIIELFNASSEYEIYDEYNRGNWYALEDYLANQIYINPQIYNDWYSIWYQTTDAYSGLFTPTQYDNQNGSEKKGMYGISITSENGFIVIAAVSHGSPAKEAGIVPGSIIISYDDVIAPENATGSDVTDLQTYLGSVDTVLLKLKLPTGETKEYTVSPGDFDEDSVIDEMTITDGVAYMIIPAFNENTDERFAAMYKKAEEAGVKSIIFDLRGNGGGFIITCYNMINLIIAEKLPMYLDVEQSYFSIATTDGLGSKSWRPDIVCLTDNNTASAAELFAGVLKYHGYARLVGGQTYGKGIGQNNLELSGGNILSITALRTYLPNGYNWNGVGLKPTVAISDDPTTAADEVLDYAYTYVDGVGAKVTEPGYYSYTYNLRDDEEYVTLETFAYLKQMKAAGLAEPVRFTFVSSNGMKMIVDADKAYDAANVYSYFGIYGDQSASAETILKKDRLPEKARVIMTVWDYDYGFSPTISLEMADKPEYFYYYDSINDVYTEFKPAYEYEDGVLRFTVSTGGIIIASPEAVK
jgi:carboxyl-terminal processing protease